MQPEIFDASKIGTDEQMTELLFSYCLFFFVCLVVGFVVVVVVVVVVVFGVRLSVT